MPGDPEAITTALAELTLELESIGREADEIGRLLRSVNLNPVGLASSASNLQQIGLLLGVATRTLTLERLKLEQISLLALHNAPVRRSN